MQDLTAAEVLGRRIAQARKKKGISQEVLADASNLHRTAIGFIERGERNITFNTLLAVCRGLGISASQLLAGIEKEIEGQDLKTPKTASTSHKRPK